MGLIEINTCNSTYVCSKVPKKNFGREEYLLIDKWIECDEKIANETRTLIKYDLDKLEETTIQKALLVLQIDKWKNYKEKNYYELEVSINEENFNTREVTWETKPSTIYYKTVPLFREYLENESINLDITDVVKLWADGSTPNYGITLSCKHPDITVRAFSCKTLQGPKLNVQGSKNKVASSVAIQVQAVNTPLESIPEEGAVLFDKIITATPSGITYNPKRGEITINQTGYYLANWWVAVSDEETPWEINFSLQNITHQTLIQASAKAGEVSQLIGNAVFDVGTVPQVFRLINNSKHQMQYGTSTIKASLIIAKI